jgi:arylsulfatase A-like enzyme
MRSADRDSGETAAPPPAVRRPVTGDALPVWLAVALLWAATLSFYCIRRLGQPPPTKSDGIAFFLTLAALALALATAAALASRAFRKLLRAERWPRSFDLIRALLAGIGLTWCVLSLVKFQATRVHLTWVDVRFLAGSLRQVGDEASRDETRLLLMAGILPVLVALSLFAGLRTRRALGASGAARTALLFGISLATLALLAWRAPYARFLLFTVDPLSSAVARRFAATPSLSLGAPRPFAPDPRRHWPIAERPAATGFRRANVVLLMLESVPWKRLLGPDARPESTPRLLALARESVVFERAYAVATHSDYAQTSILASLHPRRFGHHDFFVDLSYPRTLPWDVLQPLGYRTGLFSCQNEGWANMAVFLRTPRLERFRHAPDWPAAERRGEDASSKVFEATPVAEFLEWASAEPGSPFVAYLNFQATHFPYATPPGFTPPYRPEALDFPHTFVSYPRDRVPVMLNRFHNALASVDAAVGALVDGLVRAGLWDETILLVVSDHGEAFYEHGLPTHGTQLFEEQTRTVMFARLPGESARTVVRPVSVLDAVPSLFRWMGLGENGNFQGRSDILAPGYDGQGVRPLPMTIQGMTREDGLVAGDWKLILNYDRGARRLHHLASDPLELRNLATERPEVAAALEGKLAELVLDQLAYYRERGWERGVYPPKLP